MARTIFLNSAYEGPGPAFADAIAAGRIEIVEEESFAGRKPDSIRGLIVTSHVDQIWLSTQKAWLEAFLDSGGRMIFNGHVEADFLDGLAPYQPLADRSVAAFAVTRAADHAAWADYSGEDITFRKGVVGFYGRGCNPAPAGAVAINWLDAEKERAPVDWEWARPRGGRVLSHAGNDLWVTFEEDAQNAEFVARLIDWLECAP